MKKMCFQLASLFLNVSREACTPPPECSFLLLCHGGFFLGLTLTARFPSGSILPCSKLRFL